MLQGCRVNGRIQQINGREGETATFFGVAFKPSLRVVGFAPRHLNRSVASCEIERAKLTKMRNRMKLISRNWMLFMFLVLIGFMMPVLAQQSEPITFKLDICGRGIKPVLSSLSYNVSDGTSLFVQLLSYETNAMPEKLSPKTEKGNKNRG